MAEIHQFPREWMREIKDKPTGERVLKAWLEEMQIRNGADYRCIAGRWHIYDNGIWKYDEQSAQVSNDLAAFIVGACDILNIRSRALERLESPGFISGVLGRAGKKLFCPVNLFDAKDHLIAFPCGVYDSVADTWLSHAKENYLTLCCAVDPKDEPTPIWDEALELVLKAPELRSYIYRWAGYMLTGHTSEQGFLFLYGPGQGGKSTLLETIQRTMGSYATSASVDFLVRTKTSKHPEETASMRGIRFVVCDEIDEGMHFNEAQLKHLCSGEQMRAHFMRENSFVFKPKAKIGISANNKPSIDDSGKAFRRRIHLVEFDQIPDAKKIDKDQLRASLDQEAPGIAFKLLEGLRDWRRHGLKPPVIVVRATDAYMLQEDLIGQWLRDERIVQYTKQGGIDVEVFASSEALYDSYVPYALRHGEKPLSLNQFSNKLMLKVFKDRNKQEHKLIADRDHVDRDGIKQLKGRGEDESKNVKRRSGFYGLKPPVQDTFKGWGGSTADRMRGMPVDEGYRRRR